MTTKKAISPEAVHAAFASLFLHPLLIFKYRVADCPDGSFVAGSKQNGDALNCSLMKYNNFYDRCSA